MIQRLSERGLLTYVPYKGRPTWIGLTRRTRIKKKGGPVADSTYWDVIIGFDGGRDAIACKMEHNMSIDLEESPDRMLGYPKQTQQVIKFHL